MFVFAVVKEDGIKTRASNPTALGLLLWANHSEVGIQWAYITPRYFSGYFENSPLKFGICSLLPVSSFLGPQAICRPTVVAQLPLWAWGPQHTLSFPYLIWFLCLFVCLFVLIRTREFNHERIHGLQLWQSPLYLLLCFHTDRKVKYLGFPI